MNWRQNDFTHSMSPLPLLSALSRLGKRARNHKFLGRIDIFFFPLFPLFHPSLNQEREKNVPSRFVLPSFFYGLLITPNQTSFPSFMWQQCCLLLSSCGVIPIICSSVVPFATRTYHNRTQYERHKAGKRRRCSTVVEEATHKGNTKCLFFPFLLSIPLWHSIFSALKMCLLTIKIKQRSHQNPFFPPLFLSRSLIHLPSSDDFFCLFFLRQLPVVAVFFFRFFFSQCYHWWLLNMPITSPLSSAPLKCVSA